MSVIKGAALRESVVAEWNKGIFSQAEVGEVFGRPRGTISRILNDARRMKMHVISIDIGTTNTRRHESVIKNEGEQAYLARMRLLAIKARAARKAKAGKRPQ